MGKLGILLVVGSFCLGLFLIPVDLTRDSKSIKVGQCYTNKNKLNPFGRIGKVIGIHGDLIYMVVTGVQKEVHVFDKSEVDKKTVRVECF